MPVASTQASATAIVGVGGPTRATRGDRGAIVYIAADIEGHHVGMGVGRFAGGRPAGGADIDRAAIGQVQARIEPGRLGMGGSRSSRGRGAAGGADSHVTGVGDLAEHFDARREGRGR